MNGNGSKPLKPSPGQRAATVTATVNDQSALTQVIMSSINPFALLCDQKTLDRLIEWKMDDPRVGVGNAHTGRRQRMQRQFTIELRVDYADPEKNPSMQQALQAAARHVYATAVLLADGVKPQIAIFSDDFFTGHEVIALLEDTIARGVESIGGAEEGEDISSELMAAATK